jgi:hypothetical protein
MSFKYFNRWTKYTSIQNIFVLVIMSLPHLLTASAQTSLKGGIDWILVVDTSASMRGVGGTKNIFQPVKNSLTEFINTARLGDWTLDKKKLVREYDSRTNKLVIRNYPSYFTN